MTHPVGWIPIFTTGVIRSYANAVYLQGARYLEELRKMIGEQAFFAFLKDYSSQMAGRRATADDFFRILRLHTTLDLTGIQQRYFQRQY
jgi:aminopeptidase N